MLGGMPTRPLPKTWLRDDAIVAVSLAAVGSAMTWLLTVTGFSLYPNDAGQQVLGCILLAAPLVLRRRYPIVAGVAQAAWFIAAPHLTGVDATVANVLGFLGFYSIGAWSPHRVRALVARGVIVVAMGVWLAVVTFTSLGIEGSLLAQISARQLAAYLLYNVTVNAAFFGGAWVFGDRSWQQALERAELETAHESIRELQDELVDSAVEYERLRIARELHDVVAHHITAMSVQAAAARRTLNTNPEGAQAALKSVESGAREAVQDMRSLLHTLRTPDGQQSSLRGLDDLEGLVETARGHGRDVRLERIGDPGELSPTVHLTLYRVAQEGITNALKHAGPTATITVRLRASSQLLELEVSDDGRASPSLIPGTGTGIVGMRERIAAVGGEFHAGPKPRGGFMVRATLQRKEDA